MLVGSVLAGSEVDAATVLFPVAVARRVQAFATAVFLRGRRVAGGRGRFRRSVAGLGEKSGFAYHRSIHSPQV